MKQKPNPLNSQRFCPYVERFQKVGIWINWINPSRTASWIHNIFPERCFTWPVPCLIANYLADEESVNSTCSISPPQMNWIHLFNKIPSLRVLTMEWSSASQLERLTTRWDGKKEWSIEHMYPAACRSPVHLILSSNHCHWNFQAANSGQLNAISFDPNSNLKKHAIIWCGLQIPHQLFLSLQCSVCRPWHSPTQLFHLGEQIWTISG